MGVGVIIGISAFVVIIAVLMIIGIRHHIKEGKTGTPNTLKNMFNVVEADFDFDDDCCDDEPKDKIAKCGGCGAKNIIEAGTVCRCEYCDTPIE